jgi:hypothetical protein
MTPRAKALSDRLIGMMARGALPEQSTLETATRR